MKYEYKIDTPAVWHSAFDGCVSLLIDEMGLIYNGADEDRSAANAIGQFDFEIGRVYGKDFQDMGRQPIGWLKQSGDGTELYTEHDADAKPVLYIEKNCTFTYEEYQSLMREKEAVLQKEARRSDVQSKKKKFSIPLTLGIVVVSVLIMKFFFVDVVGMDDIGGGIVSVFAGIGLFIGTLKQLNTRFYSLKDMFLEIDLFAAIAMDIGLVCVDILWWGTAEYSMLYVLQFVLWILLGLLICGIPAVLCTILAMFLYE